MLLRLEFVWKSVTDSGQISAPADRTRRHFFLIDASAFARVSPLAARENPGSERPAKSQHPHLTMGRVVRAQQTYKAATGATVADLPQILTALLAADNDMRGSAEATLRNVARDANVVPALLTHARGDPDPQVRQLAAVVLKRRVLGHWPRLPRDAQEQVKHILLDGVVKEPVGLVRRSIADVVSKVAKATVPMGQWNALPEFLAQCTQSPEEAHRDVAFVIFASLTETIVSVMTQHFATLGGLFQNGLNDASLKVRVAALRAVLSLVTNTTGEPNEVKIIQGLVPQIIATARNAIAAGEEENAGLAFEVMDELIESQPKALSGHVPALVSFCVECANATQLETVTRRRALDVVSFLARHKPKALLRAKLVQPLLSSLCPLVGEPKEEDLAGEDDIDEAREEELQVQTVAARLVDLLALKVPARHVLPEVLQFASQALAEGAANGDVKRRHAAVAVLGIVCEGCAEGLQRRAPEILPKVVESLRDPSPDVRGGAAFTLGQMAEYLQLGYDFPHMHRDVLPALFAVLPTEPDRRVQERMMYAMDSWLEQLDDEVAPYVEPLLRISYIALDSPDARPQVKEMLLSACASAAAAAGGAMHPHLPALLPRLERCLTATEDKDLKPRARALEVLGMLVSARGGRAAMEAHVPAIMAAADSGFDLDYSELREYGHGMYAEVAEALGEGFAPYLPGCVEKAMASLRLDDGVVYDSDEEEHDRARRSMVPGGDSDDDGEDLSDSDGDGGNGNGNYSIFSGVVEEKAAACKAIASYAHHCPNAFKTHIGAFLNPMGDMADYMHEMVRSQAHHALARMAQCALKAAPPPSAEAFPIVDASLNATQRAALEDDDRDAVAAAMESAAEVIKSVAALGGGGIRHLADAGHLKGLSDHCLAVLEGRAPCQEGDDEEHWAEEGADDADDGDDPEEEDEEAELGQIVLEGVAELLPALAAVGGAEFAPHFQPHFAALMRRTSGTRPEGQRSVSYATIVEVVRAIGPAAAPVVPLALPGCCREFGAETAGLRRNTAYCAGVMVEVGGAAAAPHRLDVARALLPLLSAEETDRGVRDNAAGAAVRVLAADGFAIAKDTDAGPALLAATLAALPIAEDFEEAAATYGGLVSVFADQGAARVLVRWAPATVALFARVVGDEYAKAREGWPGKDGASKVVDAGTIARMAAAIDAMRAADANAAEAAAGMTREQAAAVAEARAGNIPQP